MQQKHYVWLALVVGLLIGFGGWLLFAGTASAPGTGSQATSTPATTGTTTTTNLGGGVSVQTTGGGTIEQVPVNSTPTPKIDRPETRTAAASATFSADVQAALKVQINTYVAQLTAAPTRTDLWLKFGVVRKMAGDYQGAIEAWNYVATAGSSSINYVAYGNLGDLYLNFLHDYTKAESSYKAALAIQPNNTDYQAGLKAAQQAKAGQ